MKTKRYWLKKIHVKTSQIIFIIIAIIISLTIFFLIQFNKMVTPKLLSVASTSINKLNETILTDFKVKDLYPKIDLANAIIITKNKNEEIISVDFNLENIYKALSKITVYLQDNIENNKLKKDILKYYNEDLSLNMDTIILSLPMGVASNFIYFANLGPRIPVKINYMGYIASNVRIKLENYGINNALISIYIDCTITNEFILPVIEEEIKHNYSILIATKVIEGKVPTYYGGVIERNSNIENIPFTS